MRRDSKQPTAAYSIFDGLMLAWTFFGFLLLAGVAVISTALLFY